MAGLRTLRFVLLVLAEAAVAFGILSFELTAARLVAPYAGLSTDTWTAIIAAFLVALAFGNLAGGRLAAGAEPPRALFLAALACAGGAAAILLVPPILPLWSATILADPPFGAMRLLLFTTLLFMPAGFLLGVATPLIVSAAVAEIDRTGPPIGLMYAAGAGGSLLGAIATLWLLHDRLGLRLTIGVLAAVLVVDAALLLASGNRASKVTPWPH